jgi:hypothetical protein
MISSDEMCPSRTRYARRALARGISACDRRAEAWIPSSQRFPPHANRCGGLEHKPGLDGVVRAGRAGGRVGEDERALGEADRRKLGDPPTIAADRFGASAPGEVFAARVRPHDRAPPRPIRLQRVRGRMDPPVRDDVATHAAEELYRRLCSGDLATRSTTASG